MNHNVSKSAYRLAIFRLSALGDATHMVPMIRTIQRQRPDWSITWIIGKAEARMVQGLENVELIVFDKHSGLAGLRALRQQLKERKFDVLLQMQLALRANLASRLIHAKRRIGYDHARSKEGHWLAINERIAPGGHHVLDAFAQFLLPLGLVQDQVQWQIPIPDEARQWAAQQLPDAQPTLLISPCSSHMLRNWQPDRYAAVANHALTRGWKVVLCGGPSMLEREVGDAITAHMHKAPLDLIGKDTFKRFLALCERASALLGPDSGPVHMANAVGTKVIGLYACTDLLRCGPYSDLRWSVDHYRQAAEQFLKIPYEKVRWGKRIEFPGVMDLISVEEVIEKFEALSGYLQINVDIH